LRHQIDFETALRPNDRESKHRRIYRVGNLQMSLDEPICFPEGKRQP
jgi:hypothetical protein